MRDLAIALCRVSTPEQIENNSLNRQQQAVINASKELNVEIIKTWSGSVSSKRGSNVKRKDLLEILAFCKRNRRVKYLIVDEPDRFMRSIDESSYWEVMLWQESVRVWYASNPELNNGDLPSKLLKFTKFLQAEGSNEERIHKSTDGSKQSVRDGRLPTRPKIGYRKTFVRGLHEIDPETGLPLQQALKNIANHIQTPTEALKWLMTTSFGKRYKNFKMDKFRKRIKDEYYCGVVEIKKNVNLRNENGIHETLITREEYESIQRVFDRNAKKQQGYRPDKETNYPLSNQLTCDNCESSNVKYPRFTSCPINNGRKRKTTKEYERYRCRNCNRYLDKDETHASFAKLLDRIILSENELKKLRQKLVSTFNSKHNETIGEIRRLEALNANINQNITNKVEAVTDPINISIREEIIKSITDLKDKLAKNEEQIHSLSERHDNDLDEFLKFAFDFLDNKGRCFFELNTNDAKRCKQLVFPAKIYVDLEKNVYTNEISPIFRYASNKKDLPLTEKSSMVRVKRL